VQQRVLIRRAMPSFANFAPASHMVVGFFIVRLISLAEGASTMFSMIDQPEVSRFDVVVDFLSWR
jgi:hypothetical protein